MNGMLYLYWHHFHVTIWIDARYAHQRDNYASQQQQWVRYFPAKSVFQKNHLLYDHLKGGTQHGSTTTTVNITGSPTGDIVAWCPSVTHHKWRWSEKMAGKLYIWWQALLEMSVGRMCRSVAPERTASLWSCGKTFGGQTVWMYDLVSLFSL